MQDVMERSALVVEDDANTSQALTKAIKKLGFSVRVAGTLKEARSLFRNIRPDLVLLDVSLPDGDGLDLMREAPENDRAQFVVVTGNPQQDVAVRSLRARASDFLLKPISLADLRNAIRGLVPTRAANDVFTSAARKPGPFFETLMNATPANALERSELFLTGSSLEKRTLEQTIKQLANTHSNVVISGPAGVDKISAACALHCASKDPGTLVHIQCATGHVLTGGRLMTNGFSECLESTFSRRVEEQNITLILDDIDLMAKPRQLELLGYLTPLSLLDRQSGKGPRMVSIQRRHRVPREEDSSGTSDDKLIADLKLCLYQSKLEIPSLRQRQQDIVPIAKKILAHLNASNKSRRILSADSLSTLERHDWPGNMRELVNIVTDAYNKTSHSLDIASALSGPDNSGEVLARSLDAIVGKTFWEVEKFLLQATLQAHNGNKKVASKVLGISLKTLYNRLNAYSIDY